jgi:flagellar basal-body rod modification protein FlgD
MAISATTNDTSTSPAADTLVSASSTNGMGKDAFLKLLVAQISHQDPLKPMDDTAFVAQLAQFSSLEQAMGMNTRLDTLSIQEQGIANTQIVNLIGKNVTVKGSITTLAAGGVGAPVSFSLAGNAGSVDVSLADASGRTVRTMHLGPKGAGLVQMVWDGRDDSGIAQAPGPYKVSVAAKDSAGASVDSNQETTGVITNIGFEKGFANLQLDNGVTAPAADLLRINRTNP